MICDEDMGFPFWMRFDFFPIWLIVACIAIAALIYLCAAWQRFHSLRKLAAHALGTSCAIAVLKLMLHILRQ